ncbi:SHOCT domain-containing protein [Nocardia flavorosea]|uniref:SHOCT domain-containing protein n=2 Tax=Nocardia flavorosea TaxID=53429 RepID=A0A846YK94_9NOCA|nr:SHOCT domain-containing protein [Nocardia flavorosea]
MMFWYDHGMSGWGYAWMGIGALVFWVALTVAVVLLIRYGIDSGRSRPQPPPDTAERILAERFARGEIGRDEFLDRLDILRGRPTR